jgi:MFS-type transporter involved in bile tolerance (Atg22 family)
VADEQMGLHWASGREKLEILLRRRRKMNDTGNTIFMLILAVFSAIAVLTIVLFGFTIVSLAILLVCIFLGALVASMAESAFNNHKEQKREQQDFGLWPDDVKDESDED